MNNVLNERYFCKVLYKSNIILQNYPHLTTLLLNVFWKCVMCIITRSKRPSRVVFELSGHELDEHSKQFKMIYPFEPLHFVFERCGNPFKHDYLAFEWYMPSFQFAQKIRVFHIHLMKLSFQFILFIHSKNISFKNSTNNK